MIVDQIMKAAAAEAAKRNQRSAGKPVKVAAWNVGRCPRQLWYGHHAYEKKDLQPRSILTFDLGDRVEAAVLDFIEAAGVPIVRPKRPANFFDLDRDHGDMVKVPELGGGWTICDFFMGAPAGYPVEDPGGFTMPVDGEHVVGEVKSMSDFGFAKAESFAERQKAAGYQLEPTPDDIDLAYLCQAEVYMQKYGTRFCLLVGYRKETSHLCEVLIRRSDERWEFCQRQARTAEQAEIPERPYTLDALCAGVRTGDCVGGKTPKRGQPHKPCDGTGLEPGGPYLPNFPCGYCDYKNHCWGTIELTVRKGRPAWRLAGETPAPTTDEPADILDEPAGDAVPYC